MKDTITPLMNDTAAGQDAAAAQTDTPRMTAAEYDAARRRAQERDGFVALGALVALSAAADPDTGLARAGRWARAFCLMAACAIPNLLVLDLLL